MADFNQNLNAILNSVYGKDVRQAIYDALVYLGNNSGSGSGNGSGTSYTPYVLPTASSTTLGGIKIGTDFTIGSDSKLNLAANKVVKKDGYTSDQILNFLHIDSNKKVVPVTLLGNLFSLGTNGLEFSTNGRLWLMQFLSKAIFSYVPAGEDDELDEAFGNEAEGAFVATFAGEGVSMQIAVPVAGADCPCIATRYGADDDWSTWNTSGSGSTTVITGDIPPATEYPVANPYDGDETKQNLQDTITSGALFAIQTANKVPEMLTENSGIVFLSGEENLINSIYEYTEAIGEAQKAVVFPVREGATVSILFAGEKNYSNNNLYPVYALNYDFENKKSYAETSLTWHNKFTPSLSNEDKSTGMQALTTALFDVPISSDASVPYNAMALIIKDGDSYDYSNAFYVAQDALLTAATTGEVTSLKKGSTTFPVRDKKAREITDRLFINDKGELFIDGKKIGNN